MLKIIGAVLVLFSSSAIGFDKAAVLKKRKDNLKNIKDAVSAMEREMSFSKHEIADIFLFAANGAQKETAKIFLSAADKIKENPQTVGLIWEKTVWEYKDRLCFSNLQTNELSQIFSSLGKTDYALQKRIFAAAYKTLESLIEKAEEECKKNTKLYQSFGILTGIFICVIFM